MKKRIKGGAGNYWRDLCFYFVISIELIDLRFFGKIFAKSKNIY